MLCRRSRPLLDLLVVMLGICSQPARADVHAPSGTVSSVPATSQGFQVRSPGAKVTYMGDDGSNRDQDDEATAIQKRREHFDRTHAQEYSPEYPQSRTRGVPQYLAPKKSGDWSDRIRQGHGMNKTNHWDMQSGDD